MDAPTGVHHDITILNNQIKNTPDSAIFIGSSSTVSVRGNQLTNVSGSPKQTTGGYPVYVKNSDMVDVSNNTRADGPAALGLGQDGSTHVTASGNGF